MINNCRNSILFVTIENLFYCLTGGVSCNKRDSFRKNGQGLKLDDTSLMFLISLQIGAECHVHDTLPNRLMTCQCLRGLIGNARVECRQRKWDCFLVLNY